MAETSKVVATISPAEEELTVGRGQLQELLTDLVLMKSRIAEAMNSIGLLARQIEEHKDYVRRSVKRMDGTAGRLSKELAKLPRVR